jgi:hypothetical protein
MVKQEIGIFLLKIFQAGSLPPRSCMQHYEVLQIILDEIKKRHLFDHAEDGLRLLEEQAEMLTGRQSTQWHVRRRSNAKA